MNEPIPVASSSSAIMRPARVRTNSVGMMSHTSAHVAPQPARTPTHFARPLSAGIRSNAPIIDRAEIIAPVPRKHIHIQRNESPHWLGSPPLSPVSTASRALSPLQNPLPNITGFRRRHTSFSSLSEHEKGPASSQSSGSLLRILSEEHREDENSPARRWIRWMHKCGLRQFAIPVVILVAALVKWCTGLGSYSGYNTPPMFGDYEAQRHWMELTIHLPISKWYTYDLQYWGLDYPPLTAYHSWLLGTIGSWINTSWFALDTSRGIETPASKVFMRATTLVSDLLTYVPSVILFTRTWQSNRSPRTQHVALLTILFQPALLLIDSGHFQYNSVMLGFALLAIDFFAKGQDLLGAASFVLSLGFKQMALYYAPAIGSYLLAKCFCVGSSHGSRLFIRLALVTIVSFTLLFLPFLPPLASKTTILQPITRIFPFSRGLFEDKVANFWCASNVLFKWRLWLSREALVKLSAALTALGFLPAVVGLLYHGYKVGQSGQPKPKADNALNAPPVPILPLLPYALLTSSMSFFLFSFQVHEKTILVPLLPLTLLLSGSSRSSFTFQLGVLMNNVAVFSMWPLLKKDGLALPYFALLLLWNRSIGYNPLRYQDGLFVRYIPLAIYAACIILHVLEATVPPPSHLPDIYPVLNVLISTPVFAFTWLWSIKRGIEVGWAISGPGFISRTKPAVNTQVNSQRSIQSAREPGSSASGQDYLSTDRLSGFRTRSMGHLQGGKMRSPLKAQAA